MKPRKKEIKCKEKNREPKKSTGRGRDGRQRNSEQDKHSKRKKIPGSGIIEFQS
jgi:hypothetical protein